MSTQSETPLIDLAPKLFDAIRRAQAALAEWAVPESGITDAIVLQNLLGILDNQELVAAMQIVERQMLLSLSAKAVMEKLWPDSGNVARTKFYENGNGSKLEVEYRNHKVYHYMDVPVSLWQKLLEAPSIGTFLAQEVKGKYRYMEVS